MPSGLRQNKWKGCLVLFYYLLNTWSCLLLVRWRWGWLRCWLWRHWFQADATTTTPSSTWKKRRWKRCSCHWWVRTFFFSLAMWVSEESEHFCVAVLWHHTSPKLSLQAACEGEYLWCCRVAWSLEWSIVFPVIVQMPVLTMKLFFYLILSVVAGEFTWNA